MLVSIITILAGCTGQSEPTVAETPAAEAVQVAVPTAVDTVSATQVTTPECVDSTPDDGVEDCASETVTTTTESASELPTIVVVAK